MYRYSSVCSGYVALLIFTLMMSWLMVPEPARSARLGEDQTPSTTQPQQVSSDAPVSPEGASSNRNFQMNFKDTDLRQIIDLMSELTQQNFLVDEKVRGKVTIIAPRSVSLEEAYNMFLSILEVQGVYGGAARRDPQNYPFPGGEGEPSPYHR